MMGVSPLEVNDVAEFRIEREGGQYVWRLVADGGRKLADSGEGFLTVDAARASIEETRSIASAAGIVDAAESQEAKLDTEGEESFPASDPPSTWAGAS